MKCISWNVNGIRACVKKGFLDFFKEADADIFCIQETKMQEGQLDLELDGYEQYWNYAVKKGYSGTAVFTKERPLAVTYGMAIEEHDQEGRVITLEYEDFYFVTVYTPNSQSELARLDYRMTWEDDFLAYLKGLEEKKPVVFCGDLNVAHKEINLKIRRQTVRMPDLQMKNVENSQTFLQQDLQIHSVICIRMWKEFILGGLTVSAQGQRMQDGELTISAYRTA